MSESERENKYDFCSRRSYLWFKYGCNDPLHDAYAIDRISINNTRGCTGYCNLVLKLLLRHYPITIPVLLFQLINNHDVHSRVKSKLKQIDYRILVSHLFYYINNSRTPFKRIIKSVRAQDYDRITCSELVTDIIIRPLTEMFEYLFIYNRAKRFNIQTCLPKYIDCCYIHHSNDCTPEYRNHSYYISKSLSFLQRNSGRKLMSDQPSQKVRHLDSIIKKCLRIFTTKNLSKLILFHI
jgi:hypothetical protein